MLDESNSNHPLKLVSVVFKDTSPITVPVCELFDGELINDHPIQFLSNDTIKEITDRQFMYDIQAKITNAYNTPIGEVIDFLLFTKHETEKVFDFLTQYDESYCKNQRSVSE